MPKLQSQPAIALSIGLYFPPDWRDYMEENRIPYLTAALFCEKILQEKDGSLSVIRIADKVAVPFPLEGMPQGAKPAFMLALLVSIKSGSLEGDFNIALRGVKPSGETREATSFSVHLSGGESGQNFILNLAIPAEEVGVHWFELIFEKTVITRIPLTIEWIKPEPPPTPQSS